MHMSRKPYDHARYAGNQGDVWKHQALLAVLAGVARERWAGGGTVRYLETHAGPGMSPLRPQGEWRRGLGRLLEDGRGDALYPPGTLEPARTQRLYPGSWRLAAAWLAAHADGRPFLVRGCELDGDAAARAERARLKAPCPERIHLLTTDGFAALPAALAEADLVLLDPPYTQTPGLPHDWDRVHDAVQLCQQRGAAFLVWYPVFWLSNPQRLVDGSRAVGVELLWGEVDPAKARPGHASKGAGVLAGGAAAPHLMAALGALEILATRLGGRLSLREPCNT